MRPRRPSLVLALAMLAVSAAPATAERLVISLSKHRIQVASNFIGEELVLFGAIEPDKTARPHRGGYDLVVTVTGPKNSFVTRRKERRLGIWVNVDSRDFPDVPDFLAVLANRPLAQIANDEVRRRLQIGLDEVPLPQASGDAADVVPEETFRRAFVRINGERNLYQESAEAVTLLTPSLFRAAISLPAAAPIGTYNVDVKLLADGVMIARTTSAFEVIKAGVEQFIAEAAHQYGLLYGLATALMALFTGWLASVVFRRD